MQYVASLSYGKDSMAMLHVITDVLHWPLDRIITADVWATDEIPAELPPMVEFKDKADRIIKERYGIEVEHFRSRKTYQGIFYRVKSNRSNREGEIYGWPMQRGSWCNGELKMEAIRAAHRACKGCTEYIGIASDEPARIERHGKKETVRMPLVEAGWTEQMCRDWCEQNGLLSPIYSTSSRGGCWFCHNQGIEQLRLLRKNYPDLWAMMLKWDADSPVSFKPNKKSFMSMTGGSSWKMKAINTQAHGSHGTMSVIRK